MPKSKKQRPSSTAGKVKGANCHKSELKTLYSKDSKLYVTNPKLWLAAVREVQKVQTSNGPGTKLYEIAQLSKI